LSFWVKAFQTGTFVAELYDNTNSRQVTKTFTINASATWEYKTIQFPADATGALANSNANALSLYFWVVAGTTFTSGTATGSWAAASNGNRAAGLTVNGASSTSNYFQFTGLQLEQNYQPTPFEQRPIGVELALCQRYYFRYTGQSAGYSRIMSTGSTYSGSAWGGVVAVPVTMRSNPTAIESSGIGVTDNVSYDSGAFTSVALSSAGSQVGGLYLSCTGAAGVSTNGSGHILILRGGASAYLGISAEL